MVEAISGQQRQADTRTTGEGFNKHFTKLQDAYPGSTEVHQHDQGKF